jgi:cytidine deaminase
MDIDVDKLLAAALAVKANAYAPYSNFFVGAAILSEKGNIYAGCNVENASYGLTVCAERSAIFQMVAAGEQRITAVLVIGDSEEFLAPCGACRQVIAEFAAEDTVVYICNRRGQYKQSSVKELIPYYFSLKNEKGIKDEAP